MFEALGTWRWQADCSGDLHISNVDCWSTSEQNVALNNVRGLAGVVPNGVDLALKRLTNLTSASAVNGREPGLAYTYLLQRSRLIRYSDPNVSLQHRNLGFKLEHPEDVYLGELERLGNKAG